MTDTWPPEPWDVAFARFRELDAWYAGDTATLAEIYSGANTGQTHIVNGRPYRGGVLGTLSKWWWGVPVPKDENRMRMHLPLAADLCTLSADLLFGEFPQVVFRKPRTEEPEPDAAQAAPTAKWTHPAQDRLDAIIGADEAHAEFLLAGEYAAAHGGTYIAVAWDPAVSKHVFPKAYAHDCAIPTFRQGRLASVKLWSEYRDGDEVYRLIEEHQPGTVEWSLRRGTGKTIGEVVPIGSHPETAHYDTLRNPSDYDVVDEKTGRKKLPLTVKVGTGTSRLAVAYMPNARPVRDWRKLGPLAHVGRSDLDGVQDLLDKVDFAWSSWMRDLDNGQGRLVVSEDALELTGTPGEGAKFDTYRQVFTPVASALGKAADSGQIVDQVQFEIRYEEHQATIEALMRRIASTIGYSEAHLGLEGASGTQTATEITADLSDSERTRDKKALYARAALSKWVLAALEIDAAVFPGDALGDLSSPPDIVFTPLSQADPEKLARVAQLMYAAEAASVRERVRVMHPDWDDDEIGAEVDAINAEAPAPVPDPATFTGLDDPSGDKQRTDA